MSSSSQSVRVSEGYASGVRVSAVVVQIAADGTVIYGDAPIGRVEKGYRLYSPPTHKGSRIVKYHKRVPEWHGYVRGSHTPFRRDTRQEVLRDLVAKAHSA